jgi:hypothetical protein
MSAGGHSTAVLAGTHHWSGSSFEKLVPHPRSGSPGGAHPHSDTAAS